MIFCLEKLTKPYGPGPWPGHGSGPRAAARPVIALGRVRSSKKRGKTGGKRWEIMENHRLNRGNLQKKREKEPKCDKK